MRRSENTRLSSTCSPHIYQPAQATCTARIRAQHTEHGRPLCHHRRPRRAQPLRPHHRGCHARTLSANRREGNHRFFHMIGDEVYECVALLARFHGHGYVDHSWYGPPRHDARCQALRLQNAPLRCQHTTNGRHSRGHGTGRGARRTRMLRPYSGSTSCLSWLVYVSIFVLFIRFGGSKIRQKSRTAKTAGVRLRAPHRPP